MTTEKQNEEVKAPEAKNGNIPLIWIHDMTWGYDESKKILFKKFNFNLKK
jgi:hypothetical protein|nr:hypothetical protein [bacterium]